MKHEIESQWMGKMQFNALVNGHTLVMDAPERVGGEDLGPIPKPFVLTALSGCTGMDVIALLRKQGKQLDQLNLKVDGEISKQVPIVYTSVHVLYEMEGKPEDEEAAMGAVTTSQEQICGGEQHAETHHARYLAGGVQWQGTLQQCTTGNGQTRVVTSRTPLVRGRLGGVQPPNGPDHTLRSCSTCIVQGWFLCSARWPFATPRHVRRPNCRK
jgi:putative redox protein